MKPAASAHLRLIALTTTLFTSGLLIGCSSATSAPTTPPQPLEIVVQPASQTAPLGSSATFNVVAQGSGTLSYQWSANGQPISGANAATYTTPATSIADNNTTYTVLVSDSAESSSLTSNTAQLTIGPRSPKAGDLRFQQVDAASVANYSGGGEASNILIDGSRTSDTFSHSIGSPIEIGPADYNCVPTQPQADCSWGFWVVSSVAAAPSITYTCDTYSALNADLPSLSNTNSVITSLDIPAGIDAYAVAVTASTQSSGFDMRQEVVSPAAVQSTVSADGLNSRVVTAGAFDASGQVHLLSYGWQADTTTLYDTTTTIVAAADLASAAQTFAQNGYIITAFGGNEVNGYVLVGTKVHGDTLPRSLQILAQGQTATATQLNGYAPVGFLNYADPTGPPQNASDHTVLYEK